MDQCSIFDAPTLPATPAELASQLGPQPEYTGPRVYDILGSFALDHPTGEDLSLEQLIERSRSKDTSLYQ
jgi:hypothetical protein